MPIITFVLAALLLIFFAVFALATSVVSKSLGLGWTIVMAVLIIILAIILIVMLCLYSN